MPKHACRATLALPTKGRGGYSGAMRVARTIGELTRARAALVSGGRPLALVPTMGALHAGHLSLIAAAKRRDAAVAASIFVNPLQFGPAEDFARYPRDEAADLAALREAGCELAWLPSGSTMYPPAAASVIEVAGPALLWEGTARPGHFRGVATVVAKLFGQIRPQLACFGEKDWQQLQVVRRMVHDLYLGIEIVAVPTVRAADGLALSSRNQALAPADRALAPRLYTALAALAASLADGQPAAERTEAAAAALAEAGFRPDYVALVDAETLEPLPAARPPARLIAAAWLGQVRLIDNVAVC
ncbi:MAG: pantoate--beta-alanine ligase [Rhodospirillales bacterium]|nr:pantoate--beta-alanine ligase [Rhodospirillales bacterium]